MHTIWNISLIVHHKTRSSSLEVAQSVLTIKHKIQVLCWDKTITYWIDFIFSYLIRKSTEFRKRQISEYTQQKRTNILIPEGKTKQNKYRRDDIIKINVNFISCIFVSFYWIDYTFYLLPAAKFIANKIAMIALLWKRSCIVFIFELFWCVYLYLFHYQYQNTC